LVTGVIVKNDSDRRPATGDRRPATATATVDSLE
jgi:hypothetical protein